MKAFILVHRHIAGTYDLHYFTDSRHATAWIRVHHRHDAKEFTQIGSGDYRGTLKLKIDHRLETDENVEAEIDLLNRHADEIIASSGNHAPKVSASVTSKRQAAAAKMIEYQQSSPVYSKLWSSRKRD